MKEYVYTGIIIFTHAPLIISEVCQLHLLYLLLCLLEIPFKVHQFVPLLVNLPECHVEENAVISFTYSPSNFSSLHVLQIMKHFNGGCANEMKRLFIHVVVV